LGDCSDSFTVCRRLIAVFGEFFESFGSVGFDVFVDEVGDVVVVLLWSLKDGPFGGVSIDGDGDDDGIVVCMCGSGRPLPVDGEAREGFVNDTPPPPAGDNNDDDNDECEALDGSGDPFGGCASFAGFAGGVGDDIVVGIV
jgi:hypothetical protein